MTSSDSELTFEEFLIDVFTPTPTEPPEIDDNVFIHAGRVCAVTQQPGGDYMVYVTTELDETELRGTIFDPEEWPRTEIGTGYIQRTFSWQYIHADDPGEQLREDVESLAEILAEHEADVDGRVCPECGHTHTRNTPKFWRRVAESLLPPRFSQHPEYTCHECGADWILTSGDSDD